ncbi:MAG: hypothetical protein M3458_06990 [Acidobacteriota bacterium]|nr:hypothetical protein [Acidobacteriota bacterium]MDQ3650018.1 hypothetical protein [Acidobacteriota bacterium]
MVAGFESRDHLAFIASNLPANENLHLAASVAPSVRDHLARSETAGASAKLMNMTHVQFRLFTTCSASFTTSN